MLRSLSVFLLTNTLCPKKEIKKIYNVERKLFLSVSVRMSDCFVQSLVFLYLL